MTEPEPETEKATPNKSASEPSDVDEADNGFWQQQRKLSYPLVAAVVLPPLFVATCFLLYRDFDRLAHEPLPNLGGSSSPAGRLPPPPSARMPTATQAPQAPTPPPTASVFDQIYKQGLWAKNDAGAGTSGTGSTLAATGPYRVYLQTLLKEQKIKSVIDAGCGDWEFSKAIDWTGIDYKGYDIVDSVIAANKKKYESASVHFFVGNIVTDDLPPADLFIAKHVFQHLPNADFTKFMGQMGKFKHLLFVDTVHARLLTGDNRDIKVGDFRFFDPTAEPFQLPGLKDLTWWDGHHMQQVVHLVRADK